MELKEALLKRRSCRKYLDKKVEEELIEELMVAAMSGPSACNKKPWKFYVVTDEEKLIYSRFFRTHRYDYNKVKFECVRRKKTGQTKRSALNFSCN